MTDQRGYRLSTICSSPYVALRVRLLPSPFGTIPEHLEGASLGPPHNATNDFVRIFYGLFRKRWRLVCVTVIPGAKTNSTREVSKLANLDIKQVYCGLTVRN